MGIAQGLSVGLLPNRLDLRLSAANPRNLVDDCHRTFALSVCNWLRLINKITKRVWAGILLVAAAVSIVWIVRPLFFGSPPFFVGSFIVLRIAWIPAYPAHVMRNSNWALVRACDRLACFTYAAIQKLFACGASLMPAFVCLAKRTSSAMASGQCLNAKALISAVE
jgi:hypothetical protein